MKATVVSRSSFWPSVQFNLVFLSTFLCVTTDAAPVEVVNDVNGISGFEFLSSGGLIWWETALCAEPIQREGTVRLRASSPLGSTKGLASDCAILQSSSANAVADGSYIYFFNNRQLHKKALNASEASASMVFPTAPFSPTLPNLQGAAFLEMADGYLWFGRFVNSSGLLEIYRIRTDGSADAQSVVSIPNADAPVRKLKWFEYVNSADNTITALALSLIHI